jgi:hypothetical protein
VGSAVGDGGVAVDGDAEPVGRTRDGWLSTNGKVDVCGLAPGLPVVGEGVSTPVNCDANLVLGQATESGLIALVSESKLIALLQVTPLKVETWPLESTTAQKLAVGHKRSSRSELARS